MNDLRMIDRMMIRKRRSRKEGRKNIEGNEERGVKRRRRRRRKRRYCSLKFTFGTRIYAGTTLRERERERERYF